LSPADHRDIISSSRNKEKTMATQLDPKPANEANDPMPLLGLDHIELWVGNATQAAHYFVTAYGFSEVAAAGLETGVRDRASRVVQHGNVRLVLTAPLVASSPVAAHVAAHGDGVRSLSIAVPDATAAYRTALDRGAAGVDEPFELADEHGVVRLSSIATYGETIHSFVERGSYDGAFLPGFVAVDAGPDLGLLTEFDHAVGNVELGRMNDWVGFYERVLGFTEMLHFSDEEISTEYSALMSKVVVGGEGRIKFPINEPAEGKRKSQVDEYLEFYGGPGVQHIAVQTPDIVAAVRTLRERGVRFLATPTAYYEDVADRVGEIHAEYDDLSQLGILVDRDDEGYLLQIFTKPIGDRPTVFFELIERHGSRGFGAGNFKALFEALEREQELRGNL
jgi:4-hydroxyphenylpyruvate dioxygenase